MLPMTIKLHNWLAMAEICHPFLLVAKELTLCSGESKISCVQAKGRFILYLVHKLVAMISRHTIVFMSSHCGVGVRVNNFSSKTTRPRDMLFFLKDTLSIEDENLFKACKSVCLFVC